MNSVLAPNDIKELPPSKCFARSIADALSDDPTLEAVTINRARQTISVATIGRTDEEKITERLANGIKATNSETSCALISGKGDCFNCETPLSPAEQKRIIIQHEGDKTTIARVTCPTAPRFWRWRDIPLPKVLQRDVQFLEAPEDIDEWKPQLAAAVLCGLCGLAGYLARGDSFSLGFFCVAYLAGGWFTAQEAWERLRKRAIDVHFLMLTVAVGSAAIGAWGEGATLLFLFSFSGALEHFALDRTQREIRSLFRDAPKVASRLDDAGAEQEIAVGEIDKGMRLLIKPGGQFPVDAEILKGRTAADESNLTGEAAPVEKSIGDLVLAGTLNLWGAVEVLVLRSSKESALQKIIHLIKEAQQQKAPAQQFTDKFGACYTYLVLGLSVAMFFVWWLAVGLPPFAANQQNQSAFYHAMTLLVVASPCALVLSIPSAVLAAIAWGARHGILFRGGAAVEKLAAVTIVALDKTGTLTTGELRVAQVETFPAGRERELAQVACSMERFSTHPLARAIVRYGKQQELPLFDLDQFESITGQGLQARRSGNHCQLGKRDWLARGQHASVIAKVAPPEAGFSEVWASEAGLIGRLVLRDDIRPQAQGVIEALRAEGLRTVVLTGDRTATADYLRSQLHLDDVRSELKPDQKVAQIRSLTAQGARVAMVGDGVNDAPSLAAAHIGVAMGARGSDAALEQADVVLMHDRLENFLQAFKLSQRARRVIRQNLVLSLGTVVVLVCFALLGKIPLTIGVVGHEGSTVIVVMNSLRLLVGKNS
jgi:Cd2+/Zn2+-exporting ATPase